MPNSVSTRGRWGRKSIDTPSARPTMAAKSALCVRMSMWGSLGKSIPLLCAALLSAPALADDDEAPQDPLDPGFVRIATPAFPSPEVHEVPIDRGRKLERKDFEPYFAAGK